MCDGSEMSVCDESEMSVCVMRGTRARRLCV